MLIGKFNREIGLYWKFIKSDLWATIIPGLVITATVLFLGQYTIVTSILSLGASFIYFNLYVYTFTLSNQLWSIEEDLINKPFRPLPAGLVSPRGVRMRIFIAIILFLLVGYALGVFVWALLWVIIQLFHNIWGHKHWLTKNVISMSLGIFVLIGAGWEIVNPMNEKALAWALLVSFILGTCGVIQDFRDVPGDLAMGRKTLPIAFGDRPARVAGSLLCLVSFLLIVNFIAMPAPHTILNTVFTLAIGLLYTLVALRLLILRSKKSDHQTYMVLLYLFCIILLSGIAYL